MALDKNLFFHIARSHMYWGRKPLSSIDLLFNELKPGDIVIDPFCGGGSTVIAALAKGARVLASDINPMAIFLTKVLIKPISIHALLESYEYVRNIAEKRILVRYQINCPNCQKLTYFDYLKWEGNSGASKPVAVKLTCHECSYSSFEPLPTDEIEKQRKLSEQEPKYWFPKARIESYRKTGVNYYHELFTKRNLSALSELNNAIEQIEVEECKDILHYVFTAMMYSCSQMQMFSDKYPSSSRGWTAPRFYLPRFRQEKNVWKSFNSRFNNVIACKLKLNSVLPFVQIADSLDAFGGGNYNVFVYQSDFRKFHFGNKELIKHIYLDPPYIDDVDYIGISKFWGSWLRMKFDEKMEWHPHKTSKEENIDILLELLSRIRQNTYDDSVVTIAFGAKTPQAWRWMFEAVIKAGYVISSESIPIVWDNSQKRGSGSQRTSDYYISIKKTAKQILSPNKMKDITDKYLEDIFPVFSYDHQESPIEKNRTINAYPPEEDVVKSYIRSAIFLNDITSENADNVRASVNDLIPKNFSAKNFNTSSIKPLIKEKDLNSSAYHNLCFEILNVILSNDYLKITYADKSLFNNKLELNQLPQPKEICEGSAFIAENNNLRIVFCFDDQDETQLENIAGRIQAEDDLHFKTIYILIVRSYDELIRRRKYENADRWPRGFFLCFDEIVKGAREVNKDKVNKLTSYIPEYPKKPAAVGMIREFNAKVLHNTPVGVDANGDVNHYILVLQTHELRDIAPGQFVMLDTLGEKRTDGETNITSFDELIKNPLSEERILSPKSFLKRPFGIHRASYKHFKVGYLKSLSLPCTLASIAHTVFPHKFEIFYKVLDDGVGTNELKKIKVGAKLRMLGPLGKKILLSELREKGDIEEVHLIGGGVGMAPLIYLGQALKYYSFNIKAFIGIDSFKKLVYEDYHAPSMGEDSKKASIYIDDLKNIGLKNEDIYISYEDKTRYDGLDVSLDVSHCFYGLVTKQYKKYLSKENKTKKVMAISCGPTPMMKKLSTITKSHNIPLKVLLEKRMACGIGVCLSCVCRKKENTSERYVRTCIEGPLFDAADIVWD